MNGMSNLVDAIAYHGWGYDQRCWLPWNDRLAGCQIALSTFDRGYFGTPQTPRFTGDRPRILLTHSYGLHLCPQGQFQQIDLLIIFSSFIEFHPQDDRAKRRSQRVLRQMIQESQTHPETVLQTFKIRCDDPDIQSSQPIDGLDQSLLTQDLEDLNTCCLTIDTLKPIPQILILHGTADQIVPNHKGQALFESLKSHAHYFEIPDAGHALPFSHTDTCWDLIYPFLSAQNLQK
jgi:pimeloyl-[acyl-carrier protein] methyl ester esterase